MSKKGSIPWNKGIKTGHTSWNKGIPMSEESKAKVSENRKGKCLGNQHGFKKGMTTWNLGSNGSYSTSRKGKIGIYTPETLEKMRQAKLGKPSPNKGKKLSAERIADMSKKRREYFKKINPDYDYRLDSKTREGNKRIRRERLKRFGGSHSTEEWEELKSKYSHTCPCCKRKEPDIKLTRDHVVSLSNKGTDNIENIQPLCVQCNSRKSTKTIRY